MSYGDAWCGHEWDRLMADTLGEALGLWCDASITTTRALFGVVITAGVTIALFEWLHFMLHGQKFLGCSVCPK